MMKKGIGFAKEDGVGTVKELSNTTDNIAGEPIKNGVSKDQGDVCVGTDGLLKKSREVKEKDFLKEADTRLSGLDIETYRLRWKTFAKEIEDADFQKVDAVITEHPNGFPSNVCSWGNVCVDYVYGKEMKEFADFADVCSKQGVTFSFSLTYSTT